MSAMVERVARALCKEDGLNPDGDWRSGDKVMLTVALDHPERWRTYAAKARAAIEAMYEPTPEMVKAADDAFEELDYLEYDGTEPGGVWRTMISAALSAQAGVTRMGGDT
jgi:hypothetical protein